MALKIDGLPVVDAKKTLHVEVLPTDIKKATRKDAYGCVMAVAVERTTGRETKIGLSRAYVKNEKNPKRKFWERHIVEGRVTREVIAYDRNGDFAEGEYTLSKPYPSNKLGITHYPSLPTAKRGTKGPRRVRHVTVGVRENARLGMRK